MRAAADKVAVVAVATTVVAGVLSVLVTGSGAAPLPVECHTVGTVTVSDAGNGTYDWSYSTAGTCQGDLQGASIVEVEGSGTSQGAGFCSAAPVTDLDLTTTLTLEDVVTDVVTTRTQRWSAPITNFPAATPFLIDEGGAGSIATRIFLNCPESGSGSDTAWIDFSFIP